MCVALVPALALTERPDVTALAITPQPVRYVGAYLPSPPRRNRTADALLEALRGQRAGRDPRDQTRQTARQTTGGTEKSRKR
ncbi:hypothetical protein MLP_19090 [Microlunatus phosphovorus NM-1]|uniref:Uncharacterized protein n=1 Tax=Microlunatus phosphovorus (strain ATCC 700054 / DSM 10555 / JCM 9379 / NBRC 101784 / NCIMB 13414 / VKM Ac-1990 / NM-1) TaxID=1032480 RepID=F5XT51_MICPN|nr:hypothetical protein MLP_19090 [Microlunatus phosphovorus NM-1]